MSYFCEWITRLITRSIDNLKILDIDKQKVMELCDQKKSDYYVCEVRRRRADSVESFTSYEGDGPIWF